MRAAASILVLVLAGCATKRALEDTVQEIGRTAAQANAGIAALSTRTQELLVTVNGEVAASGSETRALMAETRNAMTETRRLLATVRAEVAANGSATTVLAGSLSRLTDTVRDGIAANGASTLATTAAVASATREVSDLVAGMRPHLVAASAELAPTLANVREATSSLKDRADDPLISSESKWLIRIVLAAVAILLMHAVWSHLRLKEIASGMLDAPTEPEPPEDA